MSRNFSDYEDEIRRLNEELRLLRTENTDLKTQVNELTNQLQQAKNKPSKKAQPKPFRLTNEALNDWWHQLSDDWKYAYNKALWGRGEVLQKPSIKELQQLFSTDSIEIIGSGILIYGLKQLSFELTDLSGLKGLEHLKEINLSGHGIKSLEGIEAFKVLENLNLTSNKITSLRPLKHCKQLKVLSVRDNKLKTLSGLRTLRKLEVLNVLFNKPLYSISGVEKMEKLSILKIPTYKTKILQQLEIVKAENPSLEILSY